MNYLRLDTCLVIVPDLLHMFTHDPNIDYKETRHLIKEIVSAIRKIAVSRTRCVVSWNYNQESSSYLRILLPKFDKCIEVTSFEEKQSSSMLSLRIYNSRSSRYFKNSDTTHHLLQASDLYLVSQSGCT